MKHVDEYRQPVLVKSLAARLQELAAAAGRRLRIMEVCGTHTMNLFRFGLRSLLPPTMEVVSGPGCPVCVTAPADIDACLTAAGNPRVTIATFGDLLRVPGSHGSLAAARSQGSRVVMVHSPATALDLARRHPEQLVVFIGIGFETTVPTVAATVKQAAALGLDNFCLLSLHKIMPPVFARLLATGHRLDGLLYPGHVAAITGRLAFAGISETYALPGVIAGFEPVDIMQALVQLARMIVNREIGAVNAYPRAVCETGNPTAWQLVTEVFQPTAVEWRGLGTVAASGLDLREQYAAFDARRRLELASGEVAAEPAGCRCGEVISGHCRPPDCAHFGRRCTPQSPLGPCMVSSEGSCAAYFRYGEPAAAAG